MFRSFLVSMTVVSKMLIKMMGVDDEDVEVIFLTVKFTNFSYHSYDPKVKQIQNESNKKRKIL